MTEVLKYGLWPLVFLIVCMALIWCLNGSVRDLLTAWKLRIESDIELERSKVLKAERDAEIAKLTVEEEAELKRAELRKKAAEADAAAQIDAATIEARVEAERKVIAAATRGREVAAEKGALVGVDREKILAALQQLYNDDMRWRAGYDRIGFPQWLEGSGNLSKLLGESPNDCL